jgi:peroxiredoxin
MMRIHPGVLFCLVLAAAGPAATGCQRGGSREAPRAGTPDTTTASSSRIRAGYPFPDVTVLTVNGDSVRVLDLVGGHEALVFFIAVGCETCEEFLTAWTAKADSVPPGLTVIGIAEEEPAFAKRYAEQKNLPFPLYCDERGLFANKYGIEGYPSVAALYTDGKVAFMGKGINTLFTPAKATELLEQVKRQREERSRSGAAPPP